MVLNSGLTADKSARAPLLIDTSMRFPLALDQGGWKKAGLNAMDLKVIPEDPEQKLREGIVPVLRLGAYDVPKVPGVYGPNLLDLEKVLTPLNLDGVIGAGLLAHFRMTFADDGRVMWLEDNSAVVRMLQEMPGPLDALEPPEGQLPTGPQGSGMPVPQGSMPLVDPGKAPAPNEQPAKPTSPKKAPGKPGAPGPSKTTPDR